MGKKPVVAIIGRPNVGKSTLFNRMVGYRKSIVHDQPGVTRDRIYADIKVGSRCFTLVDTGGYEKVSDEDLGKKVLISIKESIKEADIILLLLDGKEGITPFDIDIYRDLKKTGKPIIFAVNKIDDEKHMGRIYDFYSLGVENIYPLSAEHNRGIDDIISAILQNISYYEEDGVEEEPIKVAIIGRANVGKSSFFNRIIGYERSIVSDIPGTTRDTVDTVVESGENKFLLLDTAGMKKRSKIKSSIEFYSINRALKAIERSDVVILMIDASEGPTDQDAKLGGFCEEEGKGIIIVVNKWDLIKEKANRKKYEEIVRSRLQFLDFAPVIFTSAKEGFGIKETMDKIKQVYLERKKRIPTSKLNDTLGNIFKSSPPPSYKGRKINLYYATQISSSPPNFILFLNYPEGITNTYIRYIKNSLRKEFGFDGVPIKIILRRRR